MTMLKVDVIKMSTDWFLACSCERLFIYIFSSAVERRIDYDSLQCLSYAQILNL
jgi:hypothetical protein